MSDMTVDPTWCAAHGLGAKVRRTSGMETPFGYATNMALSWWECPQCNVVALTTPSVPPGAEATTDVRPLTDHERHLIGQRISNHEAGHDTGLTDRAVLYLRGYESTVATLCQQLAEARATNTRLNRRVEAAHTMHACLGAIAAIECDMKDHVSARHLHERYAGLFPSPGATEP